MLRRSARAKPARYGTDAASSDSSPSPAPSDLELSAGSEDSHTKGKPRKRKAPKRTNLKKSKLEIGEIEDGPPPNWQRQFEALREFRRTGRKAAVDTMGCDIHDHVDPKTRRLHCLVSLMISAQCKDEANALVMAILKETLPRGLTLDDLLEIDQDALALLLRPSGLHNNKAKYIKQAAIVLRDSFRGDIPDSAEGMMSLPGVGPKMAMLCMASAWNQTVGIGVDTHVHRISNLLGWVQTNAPEKTRRALESWLPRPYWREINHMLVGHGQLTCRPIGRRCSECPLSQDGPLKCPSVVSHESPRKKKKKVKVEVKLEHSQEAPSSLDSYDSRFPKSGEVGVKTEEQSIPDIIQARGETGTQLDQVTEEKMEELAVKSPYFKELIKEEDPAE